MSNHDEHPFVETTESHDDTSDLNFPEDIFPEIPYEELSTMSAVESSHDSSQALEPLDSDLISMSAQVEHELDNLRLPPHSIEAEQSVLGGLLLNNLANEQVGDILSEEDFYRHHHRIIWRHIQNLISMDRPADVLTVYDALKLEGTDKDVGGLVYLNSLAQNTPSVSNIRTYAEIVRERAILRRLLTASDEIGTAALNPQGRSAREILDESEAKIYRISEDSNKKSSDFVAISDAMLEVINNLTELSQRGSDSEVTGTPTGFIDLDAKTAGLHGGDLTIVAGRPAMGKTSFSMNIVEHVALVEKKPVLVFSMEMGAAQLAHRMLGSVGKIDQQRMRKGTLNNEDWVKVTRAVDRLQHAQIFIDETPGLNPIDLRARARRLSRKHGGLGLIVVDYLQLMSGSGFNRNESRANEISEISRSLKGLARELDCPVIALSQLNRSLESRPNKRPIMSDLRESGAIEQDADVIIFIYRDEVYNENSPEKGIAEIIIGKQRNGPIGTVRLTFVGEHTKFMNYTGASPAFIGE